MLMMLALRLVEPPTATLLWVQRAANGRVSLKGFPADADGARPAARGTRPIAGSNCHPAVGSEDRK